MKTLRSLNSLKETFRSFGPSSFSKLVFIRSFLFSFNLFNFSKLEIFNSFLCIVTVTRCFNTNYNLLIQGEDFSIA